MSNNQVPSSRDLRRFYIPLALQAASQSLTYPLVAMVASRGDGGPLNLAGLAQSNTVMFLLGTMGAGLINTGMIYGESRAGFRRFCQVNFLIGLIATLLQLLASLPGLSDILFLNIIGLTPAIAGPAQLTLAATIPLQFLFFLRNPYQAILYRRKETGKASSATMFRIAVTMVLSPIFCGLGLVGPLWAVVCLSLPVGAEALLSWYFAHRHIAQIPIGHGPEPSFREVLGFSLTLSAGGFFLSLSSMLLGGVIAHAARPEEMLPVYYLASGLAAPAAFAAARMQAVTIAFPPKAGQPNPVGRFAVKAGLIVGVMPLIFCVPGLAELYYVALQKCRPELLGQVRSAAFALTLNPLAVALRAYCEGRAARQKRAGLVFTGQAVYLSAMAIIATICLQLRLPGNLIGGVALLSANLLAAATVHNALRWEGRTKRKLATVVPEIPEGS